MGLQNRRQQFAINIAPKVEQPGAIIFGQGEDEAGRELERGRDALCHFQRYGKRGGAETQNLVYRFSLPLSTAN